MDHRSLCIHVDEILRVGLFESHAIDFGHKVARPAGDTTRRGTEPRSVQCYVPRVRGTRHAHAVSNKWRDRRVWSHLRGCLSFYLSLSRLARLPPPTGDVSRSSSGLSALVHRVEIPTRTWISRGSLRLRSDIRLLCTKMGEEMEEKLAPGALGDSCEDIYCNRNKLYIGRMKRNFSDKKNVIDWLVKIF